MELSQVVLQPTRLENTLDLYFTTNTSLIKSTSTVPGLSDHDRVRQSAQARKRRLHAASEFCMQVRRGERKKRERKERKGTQKKERAQKRKGGKKKKKRKKKID